VLAPTAPAPTGQSVVDYVSAADAMLSLERYLVENTRSKLERQFGSGGAPPPTTAQGDGEGGGGPQFAFLDEAGFCRHLAAFANNAAKLCAPLGESVVPWTMDLSGPNKWMWEILGYERKLRGWLAELLTAKDKPAAARRKYVFVVCRVNEQARYLFLLEEAPDAYGVLRLSDSLWNVDLTNREVYPLPAHVVLSKYKLRHWLERQDIALRE
jgi:hypothetical protein